MNRICLGGKLVQHTNTTKIYYLTTKCTKWPYYLSIGHKIYQHLPFQDPPKFTQNGIFGLKMYLPSGNPGNSTQNSDEIRFDLKSSFRRRLVVGHRFPALETDSKVVRWSGGQRQGCQIKCFNTKIPIWLYFGVPRSGKCWCILWSFLIFYGHLVCFVIIF
jgi:hypothetical protein